MKRQKYWWLGFVGLIGIYEFPDAMAAFQGSASAWEYLSLTWLIWFAYFIPESGAQKPEGHNDQA